MNSKLTEYSHYMTYGNNRASGITRFLFLLFFLPSLLCAIFWQIVRQKSRIMRIAQYFLSEIYVLIY